jgi:hypothetical protein
LDENIMPSSPPVTIFNNWTQPSYEVRVRSDQLYLWGSASLLQNPSFARPPVIHIRNDVFGDSVTVGKLQAGGAQTDIGTLKPGECVSIELSDVSGIYASCLTETTVACLIKENG